MIDRRMSKTCNRVKTSSLFFAIGKTNDRSIMTSQKLVRVKWMPSKTMTNYCNALKKNKWLSTKAQQVFLTSALKLLRLSRRLSTQELYFLYYPPRYQEHLKGNNLTIIKPGALHWDPLCDWLCSQFDRTQRRKVEQTYVYSIWQKM